MNSTINENKEPRLGNSDSNTDTKPASNGAAKEQEQGSNAPEPKLTKSAKRRNRRVKAQAKTAAVAASRTAAEKEVADFAKTVKSKGNKSQKARKGAPVQEVQGEDPSRVRKKQRKKTKRPKKASPQVPVATSIVVESGVVTWGADGLHVKPIKQQTPKGNGPEKLSRRNKLIERAVAAATMHERRWAEYVVQNPDVIYVNPKTQAERWDMYLRRELNLRFHSSEAVGEIVVELQRREDKQRKFVANQRTFPGLPEHYEKRKGQQAAKTKTPEDLEWASPAHVPLTQSTGPDMSLLVAEGEKVVAIPVAKPGVYTSSGYSYSSRTTDSSEKVYDYNLHLRSDNSKFIAWLTKLYETDSVRFGDAPATGITIAIQLALMTLPSTNRNNFYYFERDSIPLNMNNAVLVVDSKGNETKALPCNHKIFDICNDCNDARTVIAPWAPSDFVRSLMAVRGKVFVLRMRAGEFWSYHHAENGTGWVMKGVSSEAVICDTTVAGRMTYKGYNTDVKHLNAAFSLIEIRPCSGSPPKRPGNFFTDLAKSRPYNLLTMVKSFFSNQIDIVYENGVLQYKSGKVEAPVSLVDKARENCVGVDGEAADGYSKRGASRALSDLPADEKQSYDANSVAAIALAMHNASLDVSSWWSWWTDLFAAPWKFTNERKHAGLVNDIMTVGGAITVSLLTAGLIGRSGLISNTIIRLLSTTGTTATGSISPETYAYVPPSMVGMSCMIMAFVYEALAERQLDLGLGTGGLYYFKSTLDLFIVTTLHNFTYEAIYSSTLAPALEEIVKGVIAKFFGNTLKSRIGSAVGFGLFEAIANGENPYMKILLHTSFALSGAPVIAHRFTNVITHINTGLLALNYFPNVYDYHSQTRTGKIHGTVGFIRDFFPQNMAPTTAIAEEQRPANLFTTAYYWLFGRRNNTLVRESVATMGTIRSPEVSSFNYAAQRVSVVTSGDYRLALRRALRHDNMDWMRFCVLPGRDGRPGGFVRDVLSGVRANSAFVVSVLLRAGLPILRPLELNDTPVDLMLKSRNREVLHQLLVFLQENELYGAQVVQFERGGKCFGERYLESFAYQSKEWQVRANTIKTNNADDYTLAWLKLIHQHLPNNSDVDETAIIPFAQYDDYQFRPANFLGDDSWLYYASPLFEANAIALAGLMSWPARMVCAATIQIVETGMSHELPINSHIGAWILYGAYAFMPLKTFPAILALHYYYDLYIADRPANLALTAWATKKCKTAQSLSKGLPGICYQEQSGSDTIQALSPTATFEPSRTFTCSDRLGVWLLGPGLEDVRPAVMRSCYHNEEAAICTRVANQTDYEIVPGSSTEAAVTKVWESLDKQLRGEFTRFWWRKITQCDQFFEMGKLIPVKFLTWNSQYPLGQRERNIKASREIEKSGIVEKDLTIRAFVKIEKIPVNRKVFDTKTVQPRLIQGRSDKVKVVMGPFTSACGKLLRAALGPKSDAPVVYAPGSSAEELGEWFQAQLESGLFPIELDGKRYDRHKHYIAEKSWTNDMIDLGLPRVAKKVVMSRQPPNRQRGTTRNGSKYSMYGQTASGDGDTTAGNTAINIKMALRYVINNQDCRAVISGDNTLFMVRPNVEAHSARIVACYAECGFPFEADIRDYMDTRFCSARFYRIGKRWKPGPLIGRVLGKTFWSTKDYSPRKRRQYLRSVALSLLTSTMHVPILRSVVSNIIRNTSGDHALSLPVKEKSHKIRAEFGENPTNETYAQVASLYGTTVEYLKILEMKINKMDLTQPTLFSSPFFTRVVEVDL